MSTLDDVPEPLAAAEGAPLDDALRPLVIARIRLLLQAGGLDPATVVCRVESEPSGPRVRIELPAVVSPAIRRALAVRVLDAVGALHRNVGQAKVSVEVVTQQEPRSTGARG